MSDLEHDTLTRRRQSGTARNPSVATVRSDDGTAIAFERVGHGPPLILVDGAFCHRALGPSGPLATLLAQNFTVITYDRRGRGDSGDTAPYAPEREVEDLQVLIDQAVGPAYLWGISSGAALALEATRRGADVTKLALYEPPFIIDDSRPPIPADIVAQLTALITTNRRDDAVRLFLRHMGAPAIAAAVMRLLPAWKKLTPIAHTLPYDMTILAPYQTGTALPTDRWNDVKIPILVMVGGNSPTWFHHSTRALADALPNAAHHVITGQTHNVKAKTLAQPLTKFFTT